MSGLSKQFMSLGLKSLEDSLGKNKIIVKGANEPIDTKKDLVSIPGGNIVEGAPKKVVIKGDVPKGKSTKKILIKGGAEPEVKLPPADPVVTTGDIDIDDANLLERVRKETVSNSPKKANASVVQENFAEMSDGDRDRIREIIATLPEGTTVDDVIKKGTNKKVALGLMAAPVVSQAGELEGGAGFVLDSMGEGDDLNTIGQTLRENDIPQEEIDDAILAAGQQFRSMVMEGGGTDEDAREGLRDRGYLESHLAGVFAEELGVIKKGPVSYIDTIKKAEQSVFNLIKNNEALQLPDNFSIADLDAMYANTYGKWSTVLDQTRGSLFNNKEARERAKQDTAEMNARLRAGLMKFGHKAEINPNTGAVQVQDRAGNMVDLDIPIFDSLVSGTIAGGANILGGLSAGTLAFRATPGPIPLKMAASVVAGGVAGGLGQGVDSFRNTLLLKEKLDSELMHSQMVEAGMFDLVAGIVGETVIVAGAKTARGIYGALRSLITKNGAGAQKLLHDMYNIDENQAKALVEGYEKKIGLRSTYSSKRDQELQILSQTNPDNENLVALAAKINPKGGLQVAKSISDRADDVISTSKAFSADTRIGGILTDELTNYKTAVKENFSSVRQEAVDVLDNTDYTFDYNKTGLEPLLESMKSGIGDQYQEMAFSRLLNQAQQIGATRGTDVPRLVDVAGQPIATTTPDIKLRQFSDLLDLRKMVNGVKSNKSLKTLSSEKAVDSVIKSIDSEIDKAVKAGMENGEEWLTKWKNTNTNYSEMLKLNDNVLHNALIASSKDPKQIMQILTSHINDVDSTFIDVMNKLPPKILELTENTVIDFYVQGKSVAKGVPGGFRAINFNQLADNIKDIPFKSKSARDHRDAIMQQALVFKNDVHTSAAARQVSIAKFDAILGSDPVVRTKIATMRAAYNYGRQFFPGRAGESAALIMKMSRVMDNPLSHKSTKELIAAMPKDTGLPKTLKELQQAYVKDGERSKGAYVEVYRNASDKNMLNPSKGDLGQGVYYKNNKEAAGAGAQSKRIMPERIADMETLKRITGNENFTAKDIANNPGLKDQLESQGYVGITVDDSVMLF